MRKYRYSAGDSGEIGETRKEGRRGEWLCRRLDIPCDVLPHGSLLTLRGRGQLSFEGGEKIIEYKRERISVEVGSSVLKIEGSGLECVSYSRGRMAVEGVIDSISFEDKKRGEKK